MIVPSIDITNFNILVTYDLSGDTPQICLQANSVGAGEALVKYIYKITAPSGAIIHEGDATFAVPDATGNTPVVCYDLPLFNGTIEPSGPDYVVIATMQDTALEEWSQTISTALCPPSGNDVAGSWYGQASIAKQVLCENAEILLSDRSNYDYKGYPKTLISSTFTLIFPADPETGIQPAPVVVSGSSDAIFAITYNGNYEGRLVTIYSYDLGSGVTLKIKYTTYNAELGIHIPIAVECYIDLCPLLCEYEEFIDSTEKLCGVNDVQYTKNQRTLALINGKILSVMMRQRCGKFVGDIIAEIKTISGFKCNCDCSSNGVVKRSLVSTYASGTMVWTIVSSCGDIVGSFSNVGNNYTLTLGDKSYVFAVSGGATTLGFSVANTLVGCVRTFTLNVDAETLATQILSTINGDVTLKGLFCDLVALCDVVDPWGLVDMKCIYPAMVSTCDFYGVLNQGNHPTDEFNGIMVNGVVYLATPGLLYTNAAGVNAFLATLGFGFGVADYTTASGNAELTTLANVNNITRMYFKDSATLNIYSVNVNASNCTSVTPTDRRQAVVDSFCAMYNALYGVSSVLYKVRATTGTTPGFLIDVLVSNDGSISVAVVGNTVNIQTRLKVDALDTCPGYLIDKVKSNNLVVSDVKEDTYVHDYVITSTLYGATHVMFSITINGTQYNIPGGLLTTDLSGIQTALNALGLGTFVVTSPAANLVITSLGNPYTVNSALIFTPTGPTYTNFNAVETNPVSIGLCSKLYIEPKTRTWTPVTIDAALFDTGVSLVEYASLDSLDNVMINIALTADPAPIIGVINVNPADLLPVALRPRTDQKILFFSGWDSVSDNAANYIIITTGGLIQVEYNLIMTTTMTCKIDSFYYPTN